MCPKIIMVIKALLVAITSANCCGWTRSAKMFGLPMRRLIVANCSSLKEADEPDGARRLVGDTSETWPAVKQVL